MTRCVNTGWIKFELEADKGCQVHYQRLKTFLRVYENLSFKKAAETLIMTQSAVSQQIAALERAYDSELFRRKGRIIEPTAEGKALYDWVAPIVAAVEDFPDRFRALKNLEHGKLSIGATEEASLVLAPFLARFCGVYPLIQISLRIDAEERLKQVVLDGGLDFIAVDEIPDLRRDPSFKYLRWGREHGFEFIVPPDSPHLGPGRPASLNLSRETFLMHAQDLSLRSFVSKYFSITRGVPHRVIEIGSLGAIKKMVQAGAGISVIGDMSARAELQAGLLATVRDGVLETLKRKTILLLPVNREIVYSAWAFRRMFVGERKSAFAAG